MLSSTTNEMDAVHDFFTDHPFIENPGRRTILKMLLHINTLYKRARIC